MAESKKTARPTGRALAFADLILAGSSQRDAYRGAGYKAKSDASADANASKLIRNAKVAAYLAEKRAALEAKTDITRERILRELGRVGFSDLRNVAQWDAKSLTLTDSSQLTDDAAATVETVEMVETKSGKLAPRIRLHNKSGALAMLARCFGMTVETIIHKDGDLAEKMKRARQRNAKKKPTRKAAA